MYRIILAVLMLALVTACEPKPTNLDDIDFVKLEGMQTVCAKRATQAASGSFSNDVKWTDMTSVEGVAKAIEAMTSAVRQETQNCLKDIYLLGIEDGRVLEREVY